MFQSGKPFSNSISTISLLPERSTSVLRTKETVDLGLPVVAPLSRSKRKIDRNWTAWHKAAGPSAHLFLLYTCDAHVKTLEYLLRVICERGVSLDILKELTEDVEKQARGKHGWRIKKVLDKAYWRMRYPVP